MRIVGRRGSVRSDTVKLLPSMNSSAIIDAIASTNLKTIVGPVEWTGTPVRNVTKTPLVAGQWQKGTDGFDLVICENETAPEIPVGGELKLIG